MEHAHENQIQEVNEQVVVEQVDHDNTALRRITQLVWLLFGILESVLLLRVMLKLFATNTQNPFAAFIYPASQIFLWPFFGLTGTPSAAGVLLEIPSLIAMLFYAILGWIIVKLLWILFYRSPSRSRHVHDRIHWTDIE